MTKDMDHSGNLSESSKVLTIRTFSLKNAQVSALDKEGYAKELSEIRKLRDQYYPTPIVKNSKKYFIQVETQAKSQNENQVLNQKNLDYHFHIFKYSLIMEISSMSLSKKKSKIIEQFTI